MSFGLILSESRQRAASSISAVESGPPDTARAMTGSACRSAKSVLASDGAIASDLWSDMIVTESRFPPPDQVRSPGYRDHILAVCAFLLLLDAALHVGRGPGILAPDFGKRGAGRFFLVHGGKRLTEAQQRIRRLRRAFELGRNSKERFRGVAVALLLKQTFAEPILRLGYEAFVRIFLQVIAE